jgi:hypothetical protein
MSLHWLQTSGSPVAQTGTPGVVACPKSEFHVLFRHSFEYGVDIPLATLVL